MHMYEVQHETTNTQKSDSYKIVYLYENEIRRRNKKSTQTDFSTAFVFNAMTSIEKYAAQALHELHLTRLWFWTSRRNISFCVEVIFLLKSLVRAS